MKKFWILALLLLLTALCAMAQTSVSERNVPPAVMEDFQTRHQDARQVNWMREGEELYGARFLNPKGGQCETVYQANGYWIQSTAEIGYAELPDSARAWARTNYEGSHVRNAWRVTTRKYGVLYDLELTQAQRLVKLTFDQKGGLMSQAEEEMPAETATAPAPEGEKTSRNARPLQNLFRKTE